MKTLVNKLTVIAAIALFSAAPAAVQAQGYRPYVPLQSNGQYQVIAIHRNVAAQLASQGRFRVNGVVRFDGKPRYFVRQNAQSNDVYLTYVFSTVPVNTARPNYASGSRQGQSNASYAALSQTAYGQGAVRQPSVYQQRSATAGGAAGLVGMRPNYSHPYTTGVSMRGYALIRIFLPGSPNSQYPVDQYVVPATLVDQARASVRRPYTSTSEYLN